MFRLLFFWFSAYVLQVLSTIFEEAGNGGFSGTVAYEITNTNIFIYSYIDLFLKEILQ